MMYPVQELIRLVSDRFPQVELPEEFVAFLDQQETNNHQLHRVESGELLVEFLGRQNVPPHCFSSFMSSDSRLVPTIDYSVLLKLSPEEVYTYLLDQFSDLFHIQETALDSELRTGFNRHGLDHLRTVASRAVELLKESNVAQSPHHSSENETIIGAFFHDIGNILSRRYHGWYGVYMLAHLFRNYSSDEHTLQSFLSVLEIVLFHEVEYGSQLPTLNLLRPSTLSVIIADKTDVSFKRVSTKSNVPEAIQDAHVLVNLLVARSAFLRIKGLTGCFRWVIDFQSKFDSSQTNLFSSLLKVTGRVKVPQEWQSLYEDANIEYLFIFNATFLRVYLSRLYFAVRAVFALYRSVDRFEFVVDDGERGISLTRVFTPEDYQEKIHILGKHFYKETWENSYLYQALKRQTALMSELNHGALA